MERGHAWWIAVMALAAGACGSGAAGDAGDAPPGGTDAVVAGVDARSDGADAPVTLDARGADARIFVDAAPTLADAPAAIVDAAAKADAPVVIVDAHVAKADGPVDAAVGAPDVPPALPDAAAGPPDAPIALPDAPMAPPDAPPVVPDAPAAPPDASPIPTGDPATGPGGGSNLTCGGSSFPSSSILYQDISLATLDVESDAIMAALDQSNWADAPARQSLGIDFSFEVNCAAPEIVPRTYTQNGDNQPDCDLAPVPLVAGGKTEGSDDYACSGGDCHLLVYQGTRLYELYQADVTGGAAVGGTFTGTCLAIWDLTRDYWDPATNPSPDYSRGDACDGGNAADLPIAPMLLTKQELAAALAGDGIIHHALRFTMVNSRIRSSAYVHPATHYGFTGTSGGATTLPTGARLRLRGDYPLDTLPNDAARVVARTLQHYGMFLADGGNIYISATTDTVDLINNSVVGALRPHDFEMVGGGRRIGRNDYACAHVPITN